MGYYRRRLPTKRRLPIGEIIERETTWSEEEIFAWQHFQDKLEDQLVEEMTEDINTHGYRTNKEGLRKL